MASLSRSCVLAIGGLDPGGGAGILADARAITRAGAFACAATSILTVQSTSGLRASTPVPAKELLAACAAVVRDQRVGAFKIGALGSDDNAHGVADFLSIHREIPVVVDPVMIPTRGRGRLLEERGVAVLRDRVVPRASLVTANAPEASALTGMRVTRLDEARDAAMALLALGPCAVLLKGGHLGGKEAVDLLVTRTAGAPKLTEHPAPRLKLPPTHGGGCVLASLIAGRMAVTEDGDLGRRVRKSVVWAKRLHHEALKNAVDVGGDMRVLTF